MIEADALSHLRCFTHHNCIDIAATAAFSSHRKLDMNRLLPRAMLLRFAAASVLIAGVVALFTQLPPPPPLHGQEGPPREGGPEHFGPPRGPGRGGFGGPMGPGEMQEQMRASFGGINFQELGSLSEEERDKRFADMRTKSEAAMKLLDEKLNKDLDAKQVARLKQLALQRDVVAALNRAEVAKQLKLTKDQETKLRDIAGQGFPPFGPPDARQQAQADALAVLNDDQKKQWTDLTGKSFTFPEPQFGGPGFGGPGGRGPGGPGGPMGGERKIVAQFDKDADGRLNKEERTAAREFLKTNRSPGGPGGGGFNFFGGPPGGGPPGGGPGGPGGGPGGRPGGPGGFGRDSEPAKPGPLLSPNDVKPVADASLYEPTVLRTLFLEFEDSDWEAELADFNNTDVEVPATVTVDGVKYPNVGVHFRGMSSFMMVQAGSKRSLNLSFDFVDSKQKLYGYKTLNLLNAHEDPTFLHTVLYSHIARKYIPAPKANFVKLAINGESWGVYSSAQQFNKDFLAENYPSAKGARWKVNGSPMGRGGLEYIGDNIDDYKRTFSLKTNDSDKDWKALVKFCKTLNETPLDQLEEALAPMLDIDETLWFLALDNALINCDGYWIRASDYAIFRDDKGVFHIIPHDMNEAFQPAMGPGMGGPGGGMFGGLFGGGPDGRGPGGGRPGEGRPGEGRPQGEGRRPPGEGAPGAGPPGDENRPREGRPGEGRPREAGPSGPGGRSPGGGAGGNVELDPLVGLTDKSKPLRSRLLAVPSLKAKYLAHVKQIAEESLDWKTLGPVVDQYEKLIGMEIEADTKKLTSYAAFQQTVSGTASPTGEQRGRPHMGLKQFADQRRAFLLNHPEIKALGATTSAK